MRDDEYLIKVPGVPGMLTFADLDLAMQHRFRYEIVHIENRILEIFDTRQKTKSGSFHSLGKIPCEEAIVKFK